MALRAVLAAGLALLLVLVGVTLAQSSDRPAGSNYVPEVEEVVKLRGGDRHCQEGETIPGDAAALRLLIGTYGLTTPELAVRVTDTGGRRVTGGAREGGGREGRVAIPVDRVDDTTPSARVCVTVAGAGRTVLYGVGGRVRFEWLRPAGESWFAMLPTLAHRFSLGRADFLGSLLLPFIALLLAAAWAATIRLVLREVGS